MALPVGVTTCTITVGKPFSSGGIDGTVQVTVTPDFGGPKHIIWTATGDTFENWPEVYPAGEDGANLAFTVPCVDQTGWVDPSGAPITGWAYVVEVRATAAGGGNKKNTYPRRISPLLGTGPSDLDSLADTPAAEPTLGALAGFIRVVIHGDDPNVARPAAAVVAWCGDAEPVNATGYDFRIPTA